MTPGTVTPGTVTPGTESRSLAHNPIVDRRIELLSIICRLAGLREYSTFQYSRYAELIIQHFDKYRDHPAVLYVQALAKKRNFGFDAPARLAVLINDSFEPILPIESYSLERGITPREISELIDFIKDFAATSGFDSFCKKAAPIWNGAVEAFMPTYKMLDVKWFDKYFGEISDIEFHTIIAPGNGGNAYGPYAIIPGDCRHIYAIIPCSTTHKSEYWETAAFTPEAFLPVLVHEFAHSYCNPCCDKYMVILSDEAKQAYNRIKRRLSRANHNTLTATIYETIVRAVVIRYMMHHSIGTENQKKKDKEDGFTWIQHVSDAFEMYESNRERYANLETFIPVLANEFRQIKE